MADVLHVTGEVLISEHESVPELWVIDGVVSFTPPTSGDVETVSGFVLPGFVDAHCHVGLDAHGAVDDATSEAQAVADRDAGTLLIRDAGSPADTRWIDERDDLPKIIRAGRHIARTKRYIRNFAHEVEPEQLVSRVRAEARAGDGWVKLVGDWIDRGVGDLAPCWPREVLVEAIAAAQGIEFRAPLTTSAPLQAALARLRSDIAPLADDRILAHDLATAARLIASGALTEATAIPFPLHLG
jgi:imidazolonepropionase-like amidohydrolase